LPITEGADDAAVINLVVEDTEEEQLMEYRFKVIPQMVEERVKAMKDYLLDIAGIPPSEETPLPQLERHQAWLLLGGYKNQYKNLETYDLGANTFSCYIFPDVMHELGLTKTNKRLCATYGMRGYFFEVRLAGIYPGPVLLCEYPSCFLGSHKTHYGLGAMLV